MEEAVGTPIGRRVFLGMLGLGAGGILIGGKVADAFSRALAPVTAADPTGLTGLLPTAGGFRIYSVVGALPHQSEEQYRLRISGLVPTPMELTLADLKARAPLRMVKDFQCVTGWRVHDVPWTGVRLADLLDAAGAQPDAAAVTFKSFDGSYSESLTMEQARRPDVMVAYALQDKPISDAHGGPVRLYVAPMYGYKSCKWLSEIVVTSRVVEGYWERRGYDVDAFIGRSNGRDDQPAS